MARPSKYDADKHVPWVRSLARQGLTVAEIAEELGVAKSTLCLWVKDDPALSDALNEGRGYADSKVEDSLYSLALGRSTTETKQVIGVNQDGAAEVERVEKVTKTVPPNATACIFWLKNRQPSRWREKDREAAEKADGPVYRMSPLDLTADFIDAYRDIWRTLEGDGHLREVVIKGGRGSGKSSFAAELAFEVMMRDPEANIVYLRRYQSDLRPTVFQQFCRIIAKHGAEDAWKVTSAPMQCTRKETGGSVYFFGADNPVQAKSFTPDKGHVALLILEECDELRGLDYVQDAQLTYLRANADESAKQLSLMVFNPQPSRRNWMNRHVEELKDDPDVLVVDACYTHVPQEWLGQRFLQQAEWMEEHRPELYRNKLLGEVTGTGGELFSNVEERTITDEQIDAMEMHGWMHQGVDWGYEHPNVFIRVAYDPETDTVWPVFEKYQRRANAENFQRGIRRFRANETICDSADPDKIADWVDLGWNAYAAVKRWKGGGRSYAWEWLRSVSRIAVDPERTPKLLEELQTLEFESLRDGTYSTAYPDVGEDGVMATIYALNRVITAGKSPIPDEDE